MCPSTVVSIDGRIVSKEDAKISVFDRGLLYGDSVFETIATHGGKPFMLDEHIRRLRRSAGLVYIDLPVDDEVLVREVNEALGAAGNVESYLRLIVTRGTGELGLDPSLAERPCRILIVAPLVRPAPSVYARGVGAISYRTQRMAEATEASGAKVGNYLVAVLAMRQARAVEANEALIVNAQGSVVEGATSNVFAKIDGKLVTPPESAGILVGITRQLVLGCAKQANIEVSFFSPSLEEVYDAEEVFITSSVREMLPVVKLDDRTIGSGVPGPLFRELWQRYCEFVRAGNVVI
jgi:branched-chain amino acid aminotransferase